MNNFLWQALCSFNYTLGQKWTLLISYLFCNISALDIPEIYNSSLIHLAAKSGDIDLFMKIIDENQNIDINLQDKNGWTPLHIATYLSYSDMVQFLLHKNADFTIKTFDFKMTPLSIAIDNLNLTLTIYFLSKGAEFTLPSTNKCDLNMRKDYLKNLLDYANSNDDSVFCDVSETIEQFFNQSKNINELSDLNLENIINPEITAHLLAKVDIHSYEY